MNRQSSNGHGSHAVAALYVVSMMTVNYLFLPLVTSNWYLKKYALWSSVSDDHLNITKFFEHRRQNPNLLLIL